MNKKELYKARKAAGKCVILECPRMNDGSVKCKRHRLSALKSAAKARRAKGMRVVGGDEAKSLGMLSSRSKEIMVALEKIPRCSCGIRHEKCDLPARRIEMRTAGLGGWA